VDEVEQGGVDLGGMGLNVSHHAALRQLSNRLVGIMHGCLKAEPSTTSTPHGDIT
jgi:hypothetical protein